MRHVISEHARVVYTDNNEIAIKLLGTQHECAHIHLKHLARAMCSLGIIDEFIDIAKPYANLKPADPICQPPT